MMKNRISDKSPTVKLAIALLGISNQVFEEYGVWLPEDVRNELLKILG